MARFRVLMMDTIFPDTQIERETLRVIDAELLMPFLYPLVGPFGIHPTHFGLITTVALVIGFCTPPVAINIYAASGLSGLPMEEVVRGQWPAMFIGLIIVILVPGLSTWLPSVVIK